MALADKYYTIGVLGKSFGVIELMAHQAKWELRDLAKASGLPKGTLQRILLTLCELGFVSQDGKGGAYSLTLKFFKLGQRIASNNSLVEKTVNLCVAQNFDMVVMAQQVSWQILRLDSIIGSSFPIYPSASGKVYCAFLEESELLKFLNELREARPELTTDDINRFCTELAAIRREGVGFDCEEIFTGVRCVAAPIFDYTGNLVATIGCSVPTVRITEESSALLIREVIQTAAAISMSIGAPRREFMPTTRTMLHCPVRG